ncbi:hypothetical protein TNCV_4075761 [Trichonephila clavipes]|nr:hypothetical protein TNCV_4075761 [Trichonephila clavipes]
MRKFIGRCPQKYAVTDLGVGSHTAVDWYNFCREVCLHALIRDSCRIGGVDAIVVVNESKFGKMKYGRGRPMKGAHTIIALRARRVESKVSLGIRRIAPRTCLIRFCMHLRRRQNSHFVENEVFKRTATADSDVVQSGRAIFDDFFKHLWPYIGNNTANAVFQMVKRLWLIRIDQ